MGRLLLVLLLLAACVLALGYYLNWFDFSSSKGPDGQVDVNMHIDQNRIKSDAERAADKVKGVFHKSPAPAEGK
jgi:hypothetical protein